MTSMEAVCRRIESRIKGNLFLTEQLAQPFLIGALCKKSAFLQYVNGVQYTTSFLGFLNSALFLRPSQVLAHLQTQEMMCATVQMWSDPLRSYLSLKTSTSLHPSPYHPFSSSRLYLFPDLQSKHPNQTRRKMRVNPRNFVREVPHGLSA